MQQQARFKSSLMSEKNCYLTINIWCDCSISTFIADKGS